MTDESAVILPTSTDNEEKTPKIKKKRSMIEELQELRAKVKTLTNAPVKSDAVSKPLKKLYVENTPLYEESEEENVTRKHKDYLFIPKDIWREKNEYIEKLKEKKKEYKEGLTRTVQAYQNLKKTQVKRPMDHLFDEEEEPIRRRARYETRPKYNEQEPTSILHPTTDYYTAPVQPIQQEKKPLHVYSQRMIQQNMADAPGKRSFTKPTVLSLRDKIQK